MSRLQRSSALGFALLLVFLVAASADAQNRGRGGARGAGGGFGGPGGGNISLVQSEQVQKELELTDEQKQAIGKIGDAARAEMRESLGGLRNLSPEERRAKMAEMRGKLEPKQQEFNKKIDEALQPKQKERLKEISLQVRGAAALAEPEVAEQLKLSDDQRQKLKQINQDAQNSFRDARSSGAGGGDRQAAREKMTKLRSETNEKALAVLSPEQRDEFAKMQGKKFELDRSQLGGGGGGRPGRRARSNN